MTANSTKAGYKILVDADACPVKEIVSRIAGELGIEVFFIASVAHKTEKKPAHGEYIWVDSSPQSVDMNIMNRLEPGNLVVTGDFGLASLVLAKGGRAISPRGYLYNSSNIETLLTQRHIDAKIRRAGGRTKGPSALSQKDKSIFEKKLRQLLVTVISNESF